MATALLNRNNSAVTATLNEEEYVIESIQVFNHANIDDNSSHWTLNLRDGGKGNIKR